MCNSVETAQPGYLTTDPDIVMPERYASSQRVDSLARVLSSNYSSPPYTHPATYSPLKYLLVPEQPSTHLWVKFSCLPFTATLSPVFCTEVMPIGTALPVRRTVIGRQCNSFETAQPWDRTSNPDIVMPQRYASSQRVDSLAREVITPDRHTHTRLHTYGTRIIIYMYYISGCLYWMSDIDIVSKYDDITDSDRETTTHWQVPWSLTLTHWPTKWLLYLFPIVRIRGTFTRMLPFHLTRHVASFFPIDGSCVAHTQNVVYIVLTSSLPGLSL